jgi:ribosomal protein S18 acetylase RimI-like enzyme
MLNEKMWSPRKLALGRARRKAMSLVRIVFGRIFAYENMFLFETPKSKASPKTVDRSKVAARFAQGDDILKLGRLKKFVGGKAEERLKAGHLCFLSEKNGDIVSYTWVCFNEAFVDELERRIRIGSDSAYRYDDYTVPKFRGMGILPAVLLTASDYLFQSGIKEIYDLVESNNHPSLRVYLKIGSRKLGEITFIRLFNLRRYRYKAETTRDYARLKEMLSV